ncbi:MAG: geranylgeranylglycerol-phosphate geranylgeranyltransferase [Bacteroidetes bacterium]|nr:geranylgeranylglycerol-phosphate geranylgeranyltransferase [Bacteroidota bacterium]
MKLIRVENLLIIAFTLYAIGYNFFNLNLRHPFHLNEFLTSLLIISTVLIAAAGYIINDYFDVKTDLINHPETVVIDRVIKRRWAMVLHIVFSSIGLILGVYIALKCHHISLVLFQILAIVLLWFYSTHFKKQLLVGNIVVSLLTASIPLMPLIYNLDGSDSTGKDSNPGIEDIITYHSMVVLMFAGFAFLTSFAREIIKDMEDYKGDIQTGCRTMPIEWGMITSKVFTFFLLVIIVGVLAFVSLKLFQYDKIMQLWYAVGLMILPLLVLMFMVIRANTSRHFKMASLLLKFVMLSGITFMFFL